MTFKQTLAVVRDLASPVGRLVFTWDLAASWNEAEGYSPHHPAAWRVGVVVDGYVVIEGAGRDGAMALNALAQRLTAGDRLAVPIPIADWL